MKNTAENPQLHLQNVSSCEKLFRVKEFAGEFIVQRKYIETEGFLWWKKAVEKWRDVDVFGRGCIFVPLSHGLSINTYKIKLDSFNTLEEAQLKISEFERGAVFYYC